MHPLQHCLGHLEEKCQKKHPELNPHKKRENGTLVTIDDLAHAMLDTANDKIGNDVAVAIATIKYHRIKDNELAMLVDGAATCTIIQDASKVSNLRSCNQVGDFHYYQAQDGGYVLNKTLARAVPGFGVDILPEAIYLAAGCAVTKLGANLTAKRAGKQLARTRCAGRRDVALAGCQECLSTRGGSRSLCLQRSAWR